MVGMEGAPRVPMLQLPGLPTVQQQASMTRQASQQSAASGPLPPMTTPRDVMVSSEHLAPASIFELRTALRAAKGAAAPDGTVTLTLAVADGLHALLVDHAKMSDAKRGLLSDKKVRSPLRTSRACAAGRLCEDPDPAQCRALQRRPAGSTCAWGIPAGTVRHTHASGPCLACRARRDAQWGGSTA